MFPFRDLAGVPTDLGNIDFYTVVRAPKSGTIWLLLQAANQVLVSCLFPKSYGGVVRIRFSNPLRPMPRLVSCAVQGCPVYFRSLPSHPFLF